MLKENERQQQKRVGLTVQREARCTNDLLSWPLGQQLHLLRGKEVPAWLHSFAGYVVAIGRKRYKVRVPVNDDKEMWVSATQVQLKDPWAI